MNAPTRAAVYVRSSVGDEMSNARQERACRAFARAREWTVAEVFSDVVTGTGRRDRPGWKAMSEAVERGDVEAVIVYSISRAARNTIALLTFAQSCEDHGVALESVSEPIGGDYGRVLLTILGALAEMEARSKGDRARLKQAELKAAGMFLGGPRPFGYDVIRGDDGARLVPNAREAALVQDAATRLLNGSSQRSLVAEWNATGVTTTKGNAWTRSHFRALMLRPLEDILTSADHRRIVRALERNGDGEHRGRFLLTGLLFCGRCGAAMVGRKSRGVQGYACVATGQAHLSVRARRLEEYVAFQASRRRPTRAVVLTDPAEPLLVERADLEDRLAALGRDVVSDAFSMTAVATLRARLAQIDDELEAIQPARDVYDAAGIAFDAAPAWEDRDSAEAVAWWRRLREDPETRAWLETLLERVTLDPAPTAGTWSQDRVRIDWRRGVETVE